MRKQRLRKVEQLPKVSELVSGRAKAQIQIFLPPKSILLTTNNNKYCVPSTLSILHILILYIYINIDRYNSWNILVSMPISQVKGLRHREANWHVWSHATLQVPPWADTQMQAVDLEKEAPFPTAPLLVLHFAALSLMMTKDNIIGV